jgi:hypothetical protein
LYFTTSVTTKAARNSMMEIEFAGGWANVATEVAVVPVALRRRLSAALL